MAEFSGSRSRNQNPGRDGRDWLNTLLKAAAWTILKRHSTDRERPQGLGDAPWQSRTSSSTLTLPSSGNAVEEFALSLAAQTGAHVTAAGISLKYLPFGMIQDVSTYNAFTQLTDESRAKIEGAYKKFEAAAPAGVQSELVVIEVPDQEASRRFGELGRHFDVSVVGQGTRFTQEDVNLMVQGALFYSGKPLLIVPNIHKGPAKLGKAMVCWDGGIAAARAIAGALPLLCRAGKVEVVRVAEEGQTLGELPGFNIARHLARHGISVTLKELPLTSDAAAAISVLFRAQQS